MTEKFNPRAILVTGGAGFIGANFINHFMPANPECWVVNLDILTYAGNLENLRSVEQSPQYRFVRGDICDAKLVADLLLSEKIEAVLHFAAESHVDRSITGPEIFVRTNVLGTQVLLEESRKYAAERNVGNFRFLQVSTDEVYGSLGPQGFFTEQTPLSPNSPYSASMPFAPTIRIISPPISHHTAFRNSRDKPRRSPRTPIPDFPDTTRWSRLSPARKCRKVPSPGPT